MGLDWRIMDLSSYFETLEAFNEMQDPDGGKSEPGERLERFMKAHTGK